MSDKEDDSRVSSSGSPNLLNLVWAEKRALHLKILEECEWTTERLASRIEAVARMRKPTKEDE